MLLFSPTTAEVKEPTTIEYMATPRNIQTIVIEISQLL